MERDTLKTPGLRRNQTATEGLPHVVRWPVVQISIELI